MSSAFSNDRKNYMAYNETPNKEKAMLKKTVVAVAALLLAPTVSAIVVAGMLEWQEKRIEWDKKKFEAQKDSK